MRKTIAAALAAITFTGALVATAAEARPRHHYHRDRDNDGAAIAAGIAGLAIGAALASGSRDRSSYYDRGYYDRPYYGGYYDRRYYSPPRYSYYGPRRDYRHCRTVSRWDPYYGGYTRSTRCW
jgi:hypothetical protein